MRMKAAFMRALVPAMRMSLASAKAKPPPQAGPCTSEMKGCGARRMRITISLMRRCEVSPVDGLRGELSRSFRSSPAQKARPAPRSTTIRTLLSQ